MGSIQIGARGELLFYFILFFNFVVSKIWQNCFLFLFCFYFWKIRTPQEEKKEKEAEPSGVRTLV